MVPTLLVPIIYLILIIIIITLYFTGTINLLNTTFISTIMMIVSMLMFIFNSNTPSSTIYTIGLIIMVGIVCLFALLFTIYPTIMNDIFGYPISLTFILSVITLFTLWYNGDQTKNGLFLFGGVGIILLFIFLILWTCDISKIPSSNYPLMTNYFLILFIIGFALQNIYSENPFLKTYNTFDTSNLTGLELLFGKTRNKYMAMFIMFFLLVIGLYLFNPYSIMTKFATSSIFIILAIGLLLALMTFVYHYFFANPDKIPAFKNSPNLGTFLNGIYVLFALGISWFILNVLLSQLGIFNASTYTTGQGWVHLILNTILLSVMIAILYRLFNVGGYLKNSPIYNLIINTILYIPCIFVQIINLLVPKDSSGISNGKLDSNIINNKSELVFLLIGMFIIPSYLYMTNHVGPYIESTFYKQGGSQLINTPTPLDMLTSVATYQTLNDTDEFKYQYAISFWVYIDAFAPSTSSAYSKSNDILSYGSNPSVKYDAPTNSFIISVLQDIDKPISISELSNKIKNINSELSNGDEKSGVSDTINIIKETPVINDLDSYGNRLIYTHPNVLLQKWNNIIINYNGGTMDIFYNGNLVKSSIEVVPYMSYNTLSVGKNNGIKGNIANLMYFKQPLDLLTINRLYNSFKDKNPPSI